MTLNKIIEKFSSFEEVKAISIGGSQTSNTYDNKSDIDVYIFVENDIAIEDRRNLILPISSKHEIGGEYFGAGDEFFVDELGQQLDVMYWNVNWFEQMFDNVWVKNYVQNGYTTCFLYTLKNFKIMYDKDNWLTDLQQKLNTDYPLNLQKNIIKRNIMLMKDKPFASYYEQIDKAILRNDLVSINHRISAFLASYFDIIFAINKTLHPGEKRLIQYVKNNCKIIPKNFEKNIEQLLSYSNKDILKVIDNMIFNLKELDIIKKIY